MLAHRCLLLRSAGLLAKQAPSVSRALFSVRRWNSTIPPLTAASIPPVQSEVHAATAGTQPGTHNQNVVPTPDPLKQGKLWFDSVYPILTWRYDPRKLLGRRSHMKLIPPIMPEHVKIKTMRPRHKEGGVMVDFESEKTPEEVEAEVRAKLREDPIPAPLTLKPRAITADLVRGRPFMEDILARFPSTKLKVEVKGADVPQEALYKAFRDFGPVYDFSFTPPSKDKDGLLSIQFDRIESAVGARNRLHRMPLEKATLHISYESVLRTSYLMDMFNKHTRIMVALFGLLLASGTYLVFDPLRSFFVKNNITNKYTVRNNTGWKWIKDKSRLVTQPITQRISIPGFFDRKDEQASPPTISARKDDEERLRKWLLKAPERVLFITGPDASGKLALVKSVTASKANVVTIDVSHFIDKADDEFVQGLCSSVGFFPGFKAMGVLSSMMDVFTPGASKATSSAAGTQVQKVLETVANALQSIARRAGRKSSSKATDKDKEKDKQQEHDETPLFIINGFSEENSSKHNHFMHTLGKWAAEMTHARLARVVLLTESALEEGLAKAVPELKMETITLSDASLKSAVEFVQHSVSEVLKKDAIEAVAIPGGRYSDLVSLVSGLSSGLSPREAVEEIVSYSMSVVRGHLFGQASPEEEKNKVPRWTKAQLWSVMLLLADSKHGEVPYDHVLFNVFKGEDQQLRSLLRVDLLRKVQRVGRPDKLRPGSPVFLEAFKRLARDPKLRPGMDLVVLKVNTDLESAKIAAAEEELSKLQTLAGESSLLALSAKQQLVAQQSETVAKRRDFLIKLIDDAHNKIAAFDVERRRCEALVKQVNEKHHSEDEKDKHDKEKEDCKEKEAHAHEHQLQHIHAALAHSDHHHHGASAASPSASANEPTKRS